MFNKIYNYIYLIKKNSFFLFFQFSSWYCWIHTFIFLFIIIRHQGFVSNTFSSFPMTTCCGNSSQCFITFLTDWFNSLFFWAISTYHGFGKFALMNSILISNMADITRIGFTTTWKPKIPKRMLITLTGSIIWQWTSNLKSSYFCKFYVLSV